MLIFRDGLAAKPYFMTPDAQSQSHGPVTPKMPDPATSYVTNPLVQVQEWTQKEDLKKENAEMIEKVMGNFQHIDEWRAKTWLELQQVSTTAI